MNISADFGKDNTPAVSKAMQHYIFAFVQDSINRPDSLARNKEWLKDYCESENLNYSELESNLNVFFELLEEYNRASTPILFRLLKSQSQNCFIDEERFDLLKISPIEYDFFPEGQSSSAYGYKEEGITSSHGSGIVGGHIIGL